MPEIRSDDQDAETRMGERKAKVDQLIAIDNNMVTTLEKEAADVDAASAANADTSGWTPERRAFRDMYQAADVGKYVVAAAEGREIRDGAEYEYNKHVLQGFTVGDIPLEMFLDRTQQVQLGPEGIAEIRTPVNEMEYRTEVTGPDASHGTPTWMARLFADSEGTYLRASYPAVGPGRHSATPSSPALATLARPITGVVPKPPRAD